MISPRDITAPLQRITWRDGQTLTAADLGDEHGFNERMRRLHIRYLHATWGVVEGLEVVQIGAAALMVGPGYALDQDGAALLRPLAERMSAPSAPTINTTVYLVLSRRDENCSAAQRRAPSCCGGNDPTAAELGALSWKLASEVRQGRDILLARVLVAGGRFGSPLDTSIQRRATRMASPRQWADATLIGQTGWIDARTSKGRFIQADVDASDAGFIRPPIYSARLAGAAPGAAGFISVSGPGGFTFMVRLDRTFAKAVPGAAAAEGQGWTVNWLAVEVPGP